MAGKYYRFDDEDPKNRKKKPNDRVMQILLPERDWKRYILNFRGNERVILIDFRCIRSTRFGEGVLNYRKRKKLWSSPEQLQHLCQEYFASCEGYAHDPRTGRPLRDPDGNFIRTIVKPYTISGLAAFLKIDSTLIRRVRDGEFDDLGCTPEDDYEGLSYSQVMKQARAKIQAYAEERLYDKDGFNGGRFVLDCAFGWTTRKESQEIKKMKQEMKMKKEEMKLKKKMLELSAADDGEDTSLNIVIKRAGEE